MLRGKDVLWVEDNGDYLTVNANLAEGAQLGRRDRFVFKRQTTFRRKSEGLHFRVAVKVLEAFGEQDFPATARSAKLSGELEGFDITVRDGIVRAVVPVASDVTRHWKKARQGDTAYRVVNFTLPNYRRLGSDSDGQTLVEISVSRWTPIGATQLPAWVLKTR